LITSEDIIQIEEIKNTLNTHSSSSSSSTHLNLLDIYIENYIDNYFSQLKDDIGYDYYEYFIKKIEKPLIYSTLKFTNGNQIKASKMLGFNRNTLRKKIKYLEIDYKKIRKNSI